MLFGAAFYIIGKPSYDIKMPVVNAMLLRLIHKPLKKKFEGKEQEKMECDEAYMRLALAEAEKGRGFTAPNPIVGAVIVKDGKIIGQGYHSKYGGLHAEREALFACSENPKGATLYVTLEPCCHQGKTPPCTEAILQAGIARVVIGAMDVNPLVARKGAAILRSHGVEVEEGMLAEECREQNRVFFHYITTGQPYIVLKSAMTMDGKTATASGKSRWITQDAARERVHRMRHELSGIMVGSGTVLADDPSLDCRIPGLKNPVRIICDTRLRTPLDAAVVKTAVSQRTILAVGEKAAVRAAPYERMGCEVIAVPLSEGHIDMRALAAKLGNLGIDSILLEGGAALNWAALKAGIVREIHTYIAPKVFGGAAANSPVGGEGVIAPEDAVLLKDVRMQTAGTDILITAKVVGGEVRSVYGNH